MTVPIRQGEDVDTELDRLAAGNHGIGAVVSFVGLVLDIAATAPLTALELELYTDMTERQREGSRPRPTAAGPWTLC